MFAIGVPLQLGKQLRQGHVTVEYWSFSSKNNALQLIGVVAICPRQHTSSHPFSSWGGLTARGLRACKAPILLSSTHETTLMEICDAPFSVPLRLANRAWQMWRAPEAFDSLIQKTWRFHSMMFMDSWNLPLKILWHAILPNFLCLPNMMCYETPTNYHTAGGTEDGAIPAMAGSADAQPRTEKKKKDQP